MDVDIDPHWNIVMYQLIESVPFDYAIGGRVWSPKGHFEEPRIPKLTRQELPLQKSWEWSWLQLTYQTHSNSNEFKWYYDVLKLGETPKYSQVHMDENSPLYLPWMIASKSAYLKIATHSLFLVVKSSAPLDVSDFLRWGNSWDLKEGVERLEPGSWLPTTAQQAKMCKVDVRNLAHVHLVIYVHIWSLSYNLNSFRIYYLTYNHASRWIKKGKI